MTTTPNLDWVFDGLQYTFMYDSDRVDMARAELAALRADAELGRLVRQLPVGWDLLRGVGVWFVTDHDDSVRAKNIDPVVVLIAALQAAEAAGGEREP